MKRFKLSVSPIQIGIILTLLIFWIIGRPQIVDGISMNPTLKDRQLVLIQTKRTITDGFNKGDIVVVKQDITQPKLVKRIIAMEGDHIQVVNGQIILNDEVLYEDYLNESPFDTPFEIDLVIPPDNFFICGDNRNNSLDSRTGLGLVNYNQIIGRLIWY